MKTNARYRVLHLWDLQGGPKKNDPFEKLQ
jgi:hypothetical protein